MGSPHVLVLVLALGALSAARAAQVIVDAPANTTVRLGQSTLLTCRVQDQKGAVQWTKDGFGLGTDREMKAFKRYQMIGSTGAGEYHLQIQNVTIDDDGAYECQMLWADDENPAVISPPAYLSVLAEPRGPFMSSSDSTGKAGNIKAVEDEKIYVKCTTDAARPATKIVWVLSMDKEGQRITSYVNNASELLQQVGINPVRGQKTYDVSVINEVEENEDGFMTTTSTIRFPPTKSDDKRYLTCMALHESFGGRARSASTYLQVQYKPKVRVALDERQSDLREGGRAVFKCFVDAKPSDNLKVFWAKDGGRLKEIDSKTAIIDNLSMEDHANAVRCVAENSIGLSQGSMNVSIHFAPKIMSSSQNKIAQQDESVTFQCDAMGNPQPNILWYRKGMHSSSEPIAKGTTLTIDSVHSYHVGEYECVAQSKGFAPATLVHYLHMKGPPIVQLEEPTYQRGAIQLRCKIRGKPNPSKVTWFVNGQELEYNAAVGRVGVDEIQHEYGVESKLTITKVKQTDFGMYNCTAQNEYGTSSAEIRLSEQTIFERISEFFEALIAISFVEKGIFTVFVMVPWYVWTVILLMFMMLLLLCLIWRCCCCCRSCRSSESIKPTKFSDCSDVTVRCEALDEDAQEYFTNMFPSPHAGSEILRKDYISVPQSNPDLDYLPPPVYGTYYQAGTYDYNDSGVQIEASAYGSYTQSPTCELRKAESPNTALSVVGSDVCVGVYPNRGNVTVRQLNVAPLTPLPEVQTPENEGHMTRTASRISTHV